MVNRTTYLTAITVFMFWLASCSGDTSQIESLYTQEDVSQEVITDVRISYSDSARIQLTVESPLLTRKEIEGSIIEEFPNGLSVEFYQGGKVARSWLVADRAIRYPDENRIILQGNVQLFNNKNEKLETAELHWNEEKNVISTEKFVRITQPEKGDTTYGFGFVSDQHFTRFEIKRRFSGKIEESMISELSN